MKTSSRTTAVIAPLLLWAATASAAKPSDPSYEDYQRIYSMVLEEQWDSVTEELERFVKRYPDSPWADDALFWRCYALEKRGDTEEAFNCYRAFVDAHEGSSWRNDARARLVTLGHELDAEGGGENHGDLVADMAHSVEQDIALTALYALYSSRDERALDAAMNLFERTDDLGFRRRILQVLASYDTPEVVQQLTKIATSNADPAMRMYAIDALTYRHHEGTFEVLKTIAIEDTSVQVQQRAIGGIVRVDNARSIDILMEIYKNHPNPVVRRGALRMLAFADKERAVDLLRKIAFTGPDVEMQTLAISVLSSLPDGRGIEDLIQIARSHPRLMVRKRAIQSLGNCQDPRARDALLELTKVAE